jgi:hypothetical protein
MSSTQQGVGHAPLPAFVQMESGTLAKRLAYATLKNRRLE